MNLSELIDRLQKIRAEHGDDVECVISIDTDDAFNETYLDDVVFNKYEAFDTSDGYIYRVCFKGEIITIGDDED
jgi:hypothetical protein